MFRIYQSLVFISSYFLSIRDDVKIFWCLGEYDECVGSCFRDVAVTINTMTNAGGEILIQPFPISDGTSGIILWLVVLEMISYEGVSLHNRVYPHFT